MFITRSAYINSKKLLVLSLFSLFYTAILSANNPPNIVLIISDDQAWGDYGFMGHPDIQTPHLDELAEHSIVFERGYVAAPICRPSLASMVTGLFPFDHGITGNDVDMNRRGKEREIDDKPMRNAFHKLPSFIRLLTENGYLAHQSGKWWEGSWKDGGFTHGMTQGSRHGDAGLQIGRKGMGPITDFIDHAIAEEKPFLLWYAPFLPHTPHNPPERLLKKYQQPGRAKDVANYYAMCDWFDETCGTLLDSIESRGIAENTVVIYICDNGWAAKSTTVKDFPKDKRWKQYAMRSKASPYENGTRTPIMISWPQKIKSERSTHFAHSIDLFPTIASIAGLKSPADLPGINLLNTQAREQRKAVYGVMHASHNITLGNPDDTLQYLWMIEGDWKLLLRFNGKDTTEFSILHTWDTAPYRLYNLKEDPGEKNDLASTHTELVQKLKNQILSWHSAEGLLEKN